MRPDGTRNNFYDGKSHMTLTPDPNVCSAMVDRARLLHVHLPHWARQLLPHASHQGATIACDLQDIQDLDDPYRRDFIDAADYVFCSATNFDDPLRVAKAVLERKPTVAVVVGLGAQGALYADANGHRRFAPVDHPSPVVDTNGAGDSLAAGFLTARVLERRPIEEAIAWGQTAARHTCTLRDSNDLIDRRELVARVNRR